MTRTALTLNILAFAILFIGYFFTTGASLIGTFGAQTLFRFLALLVFLSNIILSGRVIPLKYLFALLATYLILSISGSTVAVNLVFMLLILASTHRLRNDQVAVALAIPTAIVVLLHLLLLNTGQLVGYTTDFAGRIRSTLGFANPNQAAAIYLSLVVVSIYAHIQLKNRASLLLLTMSYVATFYVVLATRTRTLMFALALIIIFHVLGAVFHRNKTYRAVLRVVGVLVPVFACASTYYLTTYRDPVLDAILSGRPFFFSQFMRGVTLYDFMFGWQSAGVAGVDNLYLMLLSGVGGVAFFLILLGCSYLIFRMTPRLIPLVVVLLIVSVFESFLIRPEIPASVLFLHLLRSDVLHKTSSFEDRARQLS